MSDNKNPNNLSGYLAERFKQLDMGRSDTLTEVQAYLESQWPGKTKAQSLNNDVLTIKVTNSSMASELRFGQERVRLYVKDELHKDVTIRITI